MKKLYIKDLRFYHWWLIKKRRLKIIIDYGSDDESIYVFRYYLKNKRVMLNKNKVNESNIYLHRIMRSDKGDLLHDHPWHWSSFILWGNYEETKVDPWTLKTYIVKWGVFSFRKGQAGTYHHLTLKKPIWSIFSRGKKIQEWGFLNKDGRKTHHSKHIR